MSIDIQINAVQEAALFVPNKWNKIQVNVEIDDVEGEFFYQPKRKSLY
ncbi:hypothetical protein [Vreelandella sp. EE27]